MACHWKDYRRGQRRIFNPREGGAAQYGGLFFVLAFSVPVLAALHLSFGAYWDVAIFTVLVLMVFGRIGCLLNGCCAGRPSKTWLSVYLPNRQGVWDRRIPSQVLEAALAALLLAAAILFRGISFFPGALFLFAMAAYAFGRLLLEFTRESQAVSGRLSIHQMISAAIVVFSVALLITRWPN